MIEATTKISDLTVEEFTRVVWRAWATAPTRRGSEFIPQAKAEELTGLNRMTLYRYRRDGRIGAYDERGRRRSEGASTTVYYSLSELESAGLLKERAVSDYLKQGVTP